MQVLSDVDWGPVDALADSQLAFRLKWVKSESIQLCLLPKIWIVSGEKGVGKSAIRRAIAEIYYANYLTVKVVDFDDIAFNTIHENLKEIAKITQLSKTSTLSNFWQFVILKELMRSCAEKMPRIYEPLYFKVREAATVSGKRVVDNAPVHESIPKDLVSMTANIWELIERQTYPNGKAAGGQSRGFRSRRGPTLLESGGHTSDFISWLKTYPVGGEFLSIRKEFFLKLAENKHRVILVLDGFDDLRTQDAPADSINLLFESLVDAVKKINACEGLPGEFELKAFIPHDRYLRVSLRDSDKASTIKASIRWDRGNLEEFLLKRMKLNLKGQFDPGFRELWNELMPEKVVNSHYRNEEDSFEYLLRHTMMRPRQLQIHLEHLAQKYHGKKIQPNQIAKSVEESCMEMVGYFINEYQVDHPNLIQFIGMFHGKQNVFPFKFMIEQTQKAIKRFGGDYSLPAVFRKIDTLYEMGFFGVIRMIEKDEVIGNVYCPPSIGSQRHWVEFFYKKPHPKISAMLDETKLVAIHPLFFDYASLQAHSELIVG